MRWNWRMGQRYSQSLSSFQRVTLSLLTNRYGPALRPVYPIIILPKMDPVWLDIRYLYICTVLPPPLPLSFNLNAYMWTLSRYHHVCINSSHNMMSLQSGIEGPQQCEQNPILCIQVWLHLVVRKTGFKWLLCLILLTDTSTDTLSWSMKLSHLSTLCATIETSSRYPEPGSQCHLSDLHCVLLLCRPPVPLHNHHLYRPPKQQVTGYSIT